LPEAAPVSVVRLFVVQFSNLMLAVLAGAALLSGWLGQWIDAAAILTILVLNGTLGFVQEYKAERSLAALKRMSETSARVIRDGRRRHIPAREVVVGDLIELEAGDRVPADAKLVYAALLKTHEASLTGESVPVHKACQPVASDAPLAERRNQVFNGTAVVAGRARAVVTATGLRTEMGRIATLVDNAKREPTPFQRRWEELGRVLLVLTLAVSGAVFGLGLLRGEPVLGMFLTAVSLAVAAIPEAVPAIVTMTLALGVLKMVSRHALIRRLPAVETLGATTIVCTDKTGTLTKNQMTVKNLFVAGRRFEVTGDGYVPIGEIHEAGCRVSGVPLSVRALLTAGALCNHAILCERDGLWVIDGDPTEGAILVAAAKLGLLKAPLEAEHPFVDEIPFDSERKMMTVVRRTFGENEAYVKGAAGAVLRHCTCYAVDDGSLLPLDERYREFVHEMEHGYAKQALRVLAVARRTLNPRPVRLDHEVERHLVFLGLIAMRDPVRPEARPAIHLLHAAGIRTVMITGDQRETADAIASDLGLRADGDILTGAELDAMSNDELHRSVRKIAVYARTTAEHKFRIVQAWQAHGAVVAMTGDGVNDAPALKQADVGIAMGLSGTEVTKDAADMVVTDDNIASIAAAVEEGRVIYANIQKAVSYLLSHNFGEIIVMLGAAAIGLPLPLMPVHILWINLVTDSLPALALAVEPKEPDVMRRPPRRRDEGYFSAGRMRIIVGRGVLMGTLALAAFMYALYDSDMGLERARTLVFTILVWTQLFQAGLWRSDVKTQGELGLFTNRPLVAAILFSVLLQVGIVAFEPLHPVFAVVGLRPQEWLGALAVAMLPVPLLEWLKKRARYPSMSSATSQ
jgi:Ca2+-transporting ATPase